MKGKVVIFLTMFLLFVLMVFAAAQYYDGIYVDKGYLDGNKYMSLPKEFRTPYALGVRDGMVTANILMRIDPSNRDVLSAIIKYTGNIPVGQFEAILDKYMKDNPHMWNEPMNGLVFKALVESLVKSKKGK